MHQDHESPLQLAYFAGAGGGVVVHPASKAIARQRFGEAAMAVRASESRPRQKSFLRPAVPE